MRRTTTAGIALAFAVAGGIGLQVRPASAACGTTCTGAIPVVSFICSAPPITSNPVLCPLDPSMSSQFVSTVAIPAGYGNGAHKVTMTGTVAPQQANGFPGQLAITFGAPPYGIAPLFITEPPMHPWPLHTSSVTVPIPAGTTSIRISPFAYEGASQHATWKLTFV
jgi:hypothetical protein